ncbi:MAG: ATP-binding cassette domain-containing protein [Candidatus Woesearchaeota archaeon]
MIVEGLIELHNVTLQKETVETGDDGVKTYQQKRLIDDLSMNVWKGHIHAVLGPNGAGKSTLAYLLMGLDGYTEFDGDILFEGESIKGMSVAQRAQKGLTIAWQEPARFEGVTVHKFLEVSATTRAISSEKLEEEICHALDLVGLDPGTYLSRYVDATLSGGERKRIELASIVMCRPKLVVLDEPDSGIDMDALNKILKTVRYLSEQGATILLITHSLKVLEEAEHGFLICDGRLLHKGTVKEVVPVFRNKCMNCTHANKPSPGGVTLQ